MLPSLALIGLVCRALVAPGFMPGGEDGWLQVCPASPLGEALGLDPSVHEGHGAAADLPECHAALGDDPESSDSAPTRSSENGSATPCAVGQAFGSPAVVDTVDLFVLQIPVLLDERLTFRAAARIAATSVFSRGPPRLVS